MPPEGKETAKEDHLDATPFEEETHQ